MLPNFLVIGVARGGTGWLYNNLQTHPDIFMSMKKETHFFDREYQKGIQYYQKYFDKVSGEKAVGEATPAYLHKKEVPERIYKHLGPDIKLIVSFRNPVERLYSRFWNAKTRFKSNRPLSFEEKLKIKPEFIEEGYYIDHIHRYLKYFKKEQILFLLYDDLKRDPYDYLRQIYDFLEVDEAHISPLLESKIGSAKSRPISGQSSLVYFTSRVVKRFGFKELSYQLEKNNMKEYPPMDLDTRKWLVEEVYHEKNMELQEFINRDISQWNKIV